MDRKKFIKNLLFSAGAVSVTGLKLSAADTSSTNKKLLEQVGFNHLPNKEEKTNNLQGGML